MAIEFLPRETYEIAREKGYELLGRLRGSIYYMRKSGLMPNGKRSTMYSLMRSDGTMVFGQHSFLGFSGADKAVLMLQREDGKWSVVSNEGVPITDFIYDEMDGRYEYGRLRVKRNELYGYLDKRGNEVIPCRFERAQIFYKSRYAIVTENGVTKTINLKGKEVETTPFGESPQ